MKKQETDTFPMREKALSLFGVKYGKMVKIHKKSQIYRNNIDEKEEE